ncbi:HNH endonuclease [Sphingomonas montanisoli]|uniref:HNH endonuclease n=2 Tax=Sphingomonas montanisoli TaxID=2606412 RepID=A0A5D9C110_9SPHN|nr:HNH endonuclease signature motif containing protein [Sphingomonas montanisoli]TZG24877.1 HNH endonuclease [Sphingomonas montanisoli]
MGDRIRGSAGVKARRRRLARTGGLCEICAARGRVTLATAVDHVHPLALGGEDVDENTRNLCSNCHRDVTAEQFGFEKVSGCDASGLPVDPDHPWNRHGPTTPQAKD